MNRIVLLRKRNTPCTEELAAVIQGLNQSVEEVHGPLNALAAICVLVRHDQPKVVRALQPGYRVAFVYSELEWAQSDRSRIPELIAFLKKHLPTISLWNVTDTGMAFEMSDSGTPPPAAATGDQSDRTSPPPPVGKKPPSGYGTLRLAGGYEEAPDDPAPEPPVDIEPKSKKTTSKEEDPSSTRARTEITLDELEALRGEHSEECGSDAEQTDSADREDQPE